MTIEGLLSEQILHAADLQCMILAKQYGNQEDQYPAHLKRLLSLISIYNSWKIVNAMLTELDEQQGIVERG